METSSLLPNHSQEMELEAGMKVLKLVHLTKILLDLELERWQLKRTELERNSKIWRSRLSISNMKKGSSFKTLKLRDKISNLPFSNLNIKAPKSLESSKIHKEEK